MFEVVIQGFAIEDGEAESAYNEFWDYVYFSYEISLKMIDRQPQGEGERAQIRKFLAENRWADLTFVHPDVKKENAIFQQLTTFIRDALGDCKQPGYKEEAELAMYFWLMKESTKQHLYERCDNPEKHIKVFVLLPPKGKDWILKQKCGGKMHDKILFLAMHFPTVFPMDFPDTDEDLKKRNAMKRKHFMNEVVEAMGELGGLVYFFPSTAVDVGMVRERMGDYIDKKFNRMVDLYRIFKECEPHYQSHHN